MVVEIFKNACLNRPMNTSSLVADFKGHEDQRMIADSEMNYTRVKARPNGSNIVESNMLHSFGHHVARCCMMLDDVERSLISIKHRLQHHPTFLLFSGENKNVAFVWPPCSTLLNTRMPTKLTCGHLYPWKLLTVYSCFGVAA